MPAGDDRRARRRPQGAGRPRQRLPGVRRVLGRPAARLRPAGHARPGAGHRRRRAGVLERGAGGVPAGQDPALLVPQDRQRARRAAEVRAPGREEGPSRDLERRGQGPRPHGRQGLRRRLRRQVPQAAAKITEDEDELLAFYDYPAEHWVHLRTTNPIESTFATVRLRTKVTKGHGSKAAALAMAFKLIESAQRRWRMVNAPHLVALVRAGAAFVNGKLVERPEDEAAEETKVEAALPASALRDRAGMAAWHRADLGEAGGDAAPGPGLTVAAESAEAGLSRGGLSTPSRGRVPAPGARHRPGHLGPHPGQRRHSIGPRTLPRSCQRRSGPG